MREMGRRGGKRRLETMTPEERSERAREAGLKGVAARKAKAVAKTKAAKKPTKKAARAKKGKL